MNYVGIDWAYRRAAWCWLDEGGGIEGEGLIPADADGLARLVLEVGVEVKACVETMSGAVWVKDQLELGGWVVDVAHAGKVRQVAPLACKTDKVDARVLAELCRRDLVPAVWVPSLEDRAIRERLRRRAHLVKLRTAARNRIFGLLTQFGLRVSFTRLRQPDALDLLERRGVPAVLARLDREHLDQIDDLQQRIRPIDLELRPLAGSDPRARLLATIPGVGPLIGLTFATEIGDVARFNSAAKLVGYAGLAPRIIQSGERSATGRLSKAGSRTLRWAAVEAANQPRDASYTTTTDSTRAAPFRRVVLWLIAGRSPTHRGEKKNALEEKDAPGRERDKIRVPCEQNADAFRRGHARSCDDDVDARHRHPPLDSGYDQTRRPRRPLVPVDPI